MIDPCRIGTEMHKQYSASYISDDREILRSKLGDRTFRRKLDGVIIKGIPDDYQVDGDAVSIIEIFTTNNPYGNFSHKILQCQMYMWLMLPTLTKLGYHLSGIGWVIVFDQLTHYRVDTIIVDYNPGIEDIIHKSMRHARVLKVSEISRH